MKATSDSEWFIQDTLGLNSSVDLGLNLDLKVMNLIAMRLLLYLYPSVHLYSLSWVTQIIQGNSFFHVSYAGSTRPRVCMCFTVCIKQSVESSRAFTFEVTVRELACRNIYIFHAGLYTQNTKCLLHNKELFPLHLFVKVLTHGVTEWVKESASPTKAQTKSHR